MQYSIWVIPPEPIYNSLKTIIENLARKYDAPDFEPHMTLVGNINQEPSQIESMTKEVVGELQEFELSSGPISFSTTHFQSVFVRITSTAKLLQLNLDIKKNLSVENNVFMPHMSLIYGDHDMQMRENIASKINIPPFTFSIKELVIVPATPDPREWQHIATIPFGK